MRSFLFSSGTLLKYVFTGKFKAPDDTWQHKKFELTEYELFVVTEGTLYLSYDNENFTVSSGEYLLLPPSASYRQGFRPSYCAFYWLHFAPYRPETQCPPPADNFLSGISNAFFVIPQTGVLPKPEKIVVLMKQLQDSVKTLYPQIALDAMSTSIVAELYGQLLRETPDDSELRSDRQIYSDILDFIRLHIAENLKVTDIASHFGYNAKYLSHLFAERSGMPLKQFILRQKIDTANFLLTDTNQSIADIAKALGFSDSHNFSRTYKKATGMTPSDYRNTFDKRLLYHE